MPRLLALSSFTNLVEILNRTKTAQEQLFDIDLKALDRDVERADETTSIGILLCKSADHATVEYALSCTMSPARVAEYKRVMILREVLQETFDRCLGLEG